MYIHEIQLTEKDQFTKDFNYVGKLFEKYCDDSLSFQEQGEWLKKFTEAKLCLEQGYPIIYYNL